MEKIKYNQTCLVYLAILNPLFIGSRSVERSSFSSLSSSFSSAFFIFYLAAYDIVVLSHTCAFIRLIIGGHKNDMSP